MKRKDFKGNKGITLIALIITIIVILILVAVTVRTVANSGLFDHAKNATGQWAEKQREESEINIDDQIKANVPERIPDGIYSVPGIEGVIAPTDLFDYEIIGETGNNSGIEGLSTKAARITKIKPEYCNENGYNPDTDARDFTDTNYEIIYKGEKILDTLVIPYQVEIDGEMYKITEVNLAVASDRYGGPSLPIVNGIIYPNTVERVYVTGHYIYNASTITKIILSEQLKEIGDYALSHYGISNITIPTSVTSIGSNAFSGCRALTNITIPASVTSIGNSAFSYCRALTNITIPSSVTSIGNYAFEYCSSLTNITIPSSVTSIGNSAFYGCSALTNINIKAPEGSIAGAPWGAYNATITWDYQGE